MQYNSTLYAMGAQVSAHKPNSKKSQIYKDINNRIRALLDFRASWSALITKTVINIPQATTTGGVTCTSGLTAITGTGTLWPYADVVNTTMVDGNRTTGYVEMTPADMVNINVDTLLYVNDGVYSEVAPVVEISNSTFTALFQFSHNPGTTLTTSSVAGLQLQLGPLLPVYTLLGVSSRTGSDNAGILDMAFGGATLTNSGYQLVKAYINFPDLRSFVEVYDPQQGIPLATNVSQAELDSIDPQRSSQGWPQCLADLAPSVSGTFQYELWPHQLTPYALPVLYNRQWKYMKNPTDRPPYFINPSIIIDGAIADALRRKDIRDNNDVDPYFNPQLAREFDAKFALGAVQAAQADENKCQQALTSSRYQRGGGINAGASYWQSHVNDGGW